MRIVLDTNVLVSGLLQPLGPSGQIVRLVASGDLTLCHDARVLAEYKEVLLRPRFHFEPERVEALLVQIRVCGIAVAARPLANTLPDADAEPFLEIAVSAGVRYLVTGNLKDYPVESRQDDVEVIAPRPFIEIYRAQSAQ